MKKALSIVIAGLVVASASADITQWSWGNAFGTDRLATDAVGTATDDWALMNIQTDISGLVVGGQIDIADISSLTLVGSALTTTRLAFQPAGKIQTDTVSGTAAFVGPMYGLLVNNELVTDIDGIQVGDYIGVTAVGNVIDLQPGGTGTVGLPQQFDAGDVAMNIEVIPEPATFGLLGIAGLGLFLARRKSRR